MGGGSQGYPLASQLASPSAGADYPHHPAPHPHYAFARHRVKQEIKEEDQSIAWPADNVVDGQQTRDDRPECGDHCDRALVKHEDDDACRVKLESPYSGYSPIQYLDAPMQDAPMQDEPMQDDYDVDCGYYDQDGYYVPYEYDTPNLVHAYSSASSASCDAGYVYAHDEYAGSNPASPITDDELPYYRPLIHNNRSYTLEAAITPVSPPPAPPPLAPAPRPVMGHLPIPEDLLPSEMPAVPSQAHAHAHAQQPLAQAQPPAHPEQPVRRPRGRPRKHPPLTRASPPPAVNYPFPQFNAHAEPGAAPSHIAMSLDEVPMPDNEDRPGQAIFKLNTPGAPKEPPKKKPIMACLFCRERKIACGPPVPGSCERRCNQCARRGLVCEYPKESRRGQHKRGPRAQRVKALADAAAAGEAVHDSPMTTAPIVDVDVDVASASGAVSGLGPGSGSGAPSAKAQGVRARASRERDRADSSPGRDAMACKAVPQR